MLKKLTYPNTRRDDVIDHYHGVDVPDPYRWLEDDESDDVLQWTQAQHDVAMAYLQALPNRDALKAQLTQLWDYPRYGTPIKRGNRLFFTKNDGLQPQAVWYMKEGDAEAQILLDPNALSDDGTVSVLEVMFSKDGQYMVYAISESGLDWRTFRVRDINTGDDLPDIIEKVKFSTATWLPDNSGFFYSRFANTEQDAGDDNTNAYHQLFYHELGSDASSDEMVYARPDLPMSMFWSAVSDDGKYQLLHIEGESFAANRLYYRRLDGKGDGGFVKLFDDLESASYCIGSVETTLYIQTTSDAPNKRIIAVDAENNPPEQWRDIVPESEHPIAFSTLVNNHLVVAEMQDAKHIIKVYDLDGNFVRTIDMPETGSITGLSGQQTDTELFIGFMSFLYPPTVFRYDFTTDTLSVLFTSSAPLDLSQYETQQVFYTSKDGTRVPMFLVHHKDVQLNGQNPTYLYGYGGFDVNLTPMYINWLPAWLERGGIFAMPNLRGGGEYGEAWHKAALFEKKQNTFDDFIAAAEWLIEQRYTATDKLAIAGGSNGGLLTAACMLQRPDLYGAVISQVPVADMLRFQRFTAGRYWTAEYGNADTSESHFKALYAYSPVHNVKTGVDYPPLLIATADHDDRVVPMHSKKFAAALQSANPDGRPMLLRIETKAGHGAGKPTDKQIDERVDVLAFLLDVLNVNSSA